MKADDPNLDKLATVSTKTGAMFKNHKDVGTGLKQAGIVIDAISNIQQVYAERDKAYEEILDDWYKSGIKISVSRKTDGDWKPDCQSLLAQGFYDPREIIKCRRLMNEGFAFLYEDVTEYDYVELGEEKIRKCEGILNDDVVDSIQDSVGRTKEERLEILLILWRGSESEGDVEKIEELTADEFQSYVGALSTILEKVELPDDVDEDVENIFENISVEGEYKNY